LRGLELAAQDNWDAALVEFLTSRELFPTRVALSNITSGEHRIEVYAPGQLPYRKAISVSSGRREIVGVALERDLRWLRQHVGEHEARDRRAG